MQKITIKTALLMMLFMVGSSPLYAQVLTCDDLADIGDTAEEVLDALYEIGNIVEGDEVDSALDELIDGLWMIAEVEGNSVLEEQIEIMGEGWEDMDGDTLVSGLQGAITSIDTIYSNDCD